MLLGWFVRFKGAILDLDRLSRSWSRLGNVSVLHGSFRGLLLGLRLLHLLRLWMVMVVRMLEDYVTLVGRWIGGLRVS